MSKLKTSDIVNAIGQLQLHQPYKYYSGRGILKITEVRYPEGPITVLRAPNINSTEWSDASVSQAMLATAAAVFSGKPNYPIHLDRLFSAGGNSRSVLETLLVYTPNFYISYPQRTNPYTGELESKQKHVIWAPNDSHQLGVIQTRQFDQVISEIELDMSFGDIQVTTGMLGNEFDSIDAKKTHTQMQVALVEIGNALKFHTWIAKNDHSIVIGDKTLGSLTGVVRSLDDIPILYNNEMKRAANLIDCIWFDQDFRHIPAVMEVEHSTGVTSGLTRMLKLHEVMPSFKTKYTVVAPDQLRNKVVTETNNPVFKPLDGFFLKYSTVRELYGLIEKYSLSGVIDREFINPFFDPVVETDA